MPRPVPFSGTGGPSDEGRRHATRLTERRAAPVAGPVWNHLFSVFVLPPRRPDPGALARTLADLRAQSHANAEVILLGQDTPDGCEDFCHLRGLFAEPDLDAAAILAHPATDAVWRGSHLLFAEAGTRFDPDALAQFNLALADPDHAATPDLVVSDHERSATEGAAPIPVVLPGWDPDLLAVFDDIGMAFLASRALVLACRSPGDRPASPEDWLRRVALRPGQPAVALLRDAVLRLPSPAVLPRPRLSTPALPRGADAPAIAVIVPGRNSPSLLRACLRLLDAMLGARLEPVIVDGGSDDAETLALLRDIAARDGARILRAGDAVRPNTARMVNLGVAATTAPLLLLLQSETDGATPAAVDAMLAHAWRPEVGVVGARAADRIARLRRAAPDRHPGALHNVPAVTGALLATRRRVLEAAGGFDELAFPDSLADVDYCRRVRQAGLRVLCLPMPEVAQDAAPHDTAALATHGPGALARDPVAPSHDGPGDGWAGIGPRTAGP